MKEQEAFIKKEDIKKPASLLFILVYIVATVIVVIKAPSNALIFIGSSAGISLLCWLIIDITKKIQVLKIKIKKSEWELLFALLILVIWNYFPLPRFNLGDSWNLESIFKKLFLIVVIPFIFLRLRKHPLSSMGISKLNWTKNLKVGLLIFLCMAVPSAFYSGTASLIMNKKIGLVQGAVAFLVFFVYSLFLSGFSEEFFFRTFIQTRISVILKSRLSGVLITALVFGLIHVDDIIRWYPGTTLAEAFCRAFFIQTFLGLVLGVLWSRTRNLIPGVIVHTGVNTVNNFTSIIPTLGL